MHPVQRRRRGSSRTFGSRMPCGQRAGVAPCTFFSCWAKAASSSTWSGTRVPLGRGARVWVAVHAASSTLCAHRQGVVKRLGRVGHSGILVAQPLDRCDLGADGVSGHRGPHLFVDILWLLRVLYTRGQASASDRLPRSSSASAGVITSMGSGSSGFVGFCVVKTRLPRQPSGRSPAGWFGVTPKIR